MGRNSCGGQYCLGYINNVNFTLTLGAIMDKQHKHCPVCGDVMEEVPGNDTFQIFFCRKYPCRAISVTFLYTYSFLSCYQIHP